MILWIRSILNVGRMMMTKTNQLAGNLRYIGYSRSYYLQDIRVAIISLLDIALPMSGDTTEYCIFI